MRQLIFTHLLLSSILVSLAQNTDRPAALQNLTKLDLSLLGVGVSFEPRISNKVTIDLAGGVGSGYEVSEDELSLNLLEPVAYVTITPKFYYNRERRIERGKNYVLNAGNYIGLRMKYASKSIVEGSTAHDALLFNIHWGLQRAIGPRWIFNSHFGAGYAMDATDISNSFGTIYPAIGFTFSYVLSKLKP